MGNKPQLTDLSKSELLNIIRNSKDGIIEIPIKGEEKPIHLNPTKMLVGKVVVNAYSDDATTYQITAEAGSDEVFIEEMF